VDKIIVRLINLL